MFKFINGYKKDYVEALEKIDNQQLETLFNLIEATKENGNNIFMLGNGGSAASASHWVCDFNKGVNVDGVKRLKMYSLTDNTPLFSALGNDFSYEDSFLEQVKNYLEPGDLVVGLSVSGNSENIVRAIEYANDHSANTFSIIGDFGGKMGEISNETIVVPSKNYGIVEDIHMYTCHVLSQYMYQNNAK